MIQHEVKLSLNIRETYNLSQTSSIQVNPTQILLGRELSLSY